MKTRLMSATGWFRLVLKYGTPECRKASTPERRNAGTPNDNAFVNLMKLFAHSQRTMVLSLENTELPR